MHSRRNLISGFTLSAGLSLATALTPRRALAQGTTGGGQAMWGGRFTEKPGALMQEINVSIDVDRRFWRQDITASQAHASMLVKQKIITAEDGRRSRAA